MRLGFNIFVDQEHHNCVYRIPRVLMLRLAIYHQHMKNVLTKALVGIVRL